MNNEQTEDVYDSSYLHFLEVQIPMNAYLKLIYQNTNTNHSGSAVEHLWVLSEVELDVLITHIGTFDATTSYRPLRVQCAVFLVQCIHQSMVIFY